MELITFAELAIAGVGASQLAMLITQKIKNKTGLDPEVVSMIVGAVLGALGWLYTQGTPASMEQAIAMTFYVLGAAVAPSGVYELREDLSRK